MLYYVKSNLNHNGKAYIKGDQVDLDTPSARTLIAEGVVTSKLVLSDEEENREEVIPEDEKNAEDEAAADAVDEEEKDEVIEDELSEEEKAAAESANADKPQPYIVTEQDLVNNPTLAEQGLTVGTEVWLTPEAIAQVGTPGYLASILKKDEGESAADQL